MVNLVWIKAKDGMDPSMKKKAYAFLEKLGEDDTLPGLHIEPIQSAADPRVRTGRVDDNFRAVLFKVNGAFGPTYGFYGIWPHDRAIKIARTTRLATNPVNGVPEIHRITDAEIAEADLLLAMTDSHWNVLQRRAAGLGVEPDRIRMYRELDPASAQQAEAVTVGGSSRSVLNVPDPWYGTMADFLDTLEVVERVSDEFAEQLTALRD